MIYATFHRGNEGIQKAKHQTVLRPNSRRVFMPRRSRCLDVSESKGPQGWEGAAASESTNNCEQSLCSQNVSTKNISLSTVGKPSNQRKTLLIKTKDWKKTQKRHRRRCKYGGRKGTRDALNLQSMGRG